MRRGVDEGSPIFQAEEKKRSRKANLQLQMSLEPFFGPVAPDLCGNPEHGLLGEPGEGSLGGSWVTTCANRNFSSFFCQFEAAVIALVV